MCLSGASGAGAELLAAVPDEHLRAFFVWVPMMPSDNEGTALAASHRFDEPRAFHYWDGEHHLSRRLARVLKIESRESWSAEDRPEFAWDVYLAYRSGNRDIAAPDFWMHQLAVDHAPRLDVATWRARLEEMLNAIPPTLAF